MKKLKIAFFLSFLLISCKTSPEQARKDLAALNIPFDEYAFRETAKECDELVVDKFVAAEMPSAWGLVGATEGGCLDLVKKLIKTTEDDSAKVFSLNVIASSEPQSDNLEIAKVLLNHSTDPNSVVEDQSSHISKAVGKGNMPLIELLLKKGVEVNDYNNNHSLAIMTAAVTSKELTQLLLDNGANPDSFTCELYRSDYCSPLLAATKEENLETVSLLLDRGANANDSKNNTTSKSLEAASSQKNLELVKKLVEAGATVNDPEGYSIALNNAFSKHYRDKDYDWDMIKYLVNNGAKADPQRRLIKLAFDNNQYEIAESIIKNDAELNTMEISNSEEKSSEDLVDAIKSNDPKAVKILLDNGANPNSKTSSNTTCSVLFLAKRYRYPEIINLLQEKGATESGSGYCG